MKPVVRKGDLHRYPIPGHGTTEIVTGSPSQVEGQPVARVGDKTGCGATIIEGSSLMVSPPPTWAVKLIMVARLLRRRAVPKFRRSADAERWSYKERYLERSR